MRRQGATTHGAVASSDASAGKDKRERPGKGGEGRRRRNGVAAVERVDRPRMPGTCNGTTSGDGEGAARKVATGGARLELEKGVCVGARDELVVALAALVSHAREMWVPAHRTLDVEALRIAPVAAQFAYRVKRQPWRVLLERSKKGERSTPVEMQKGAKTNRCLHARL